MTCVTDTIGYQGVSINVLTKRDSMTSLYHTSAKADLKRPDYGFILTLVCVALALVIASVVFTPAPSGITSEITFVGP